MRLFIDTEFSDFIDCDLISIGIVSEDGREFYAERNDFDLSRCNNFVKAAVLPLLGQEPAIVGTEEEIGSALRAWLAQFPAVEVCFDYSMDFELFHYLARDPDTLQMPEWVTGHNIKSEINDRDIERFWTENGRKAHHALYDAKANRFAFSCANKTVSLGAGNTN